MKTFLTLLDLRHLHCVPLAAAETYDARIAEKEILTPAPPAAPRINGPGVYGARPNKQFLYRIPCQGERPIRFDVKGLPDGLTLDSATALSPARARRRRAAMP